MTETQNLAAALAAFQAELPKIRKDETAKVTGEGKNGKVSYTYGYAGLDAVVEAVMPVLGKHGLSISSKTIMFEDNFTLVVTLKHESGSEDSATWPLPDPRRFGPQDIGSAMTYGRRYLTLALTGTFPGGEDDDGAKAQQSARDSWDDARPRQAQQNNKPAAAPPAPEKTEWSDEEITELHNRIRTLPIGNAVSGYDWMASRNLHNRPVADPDPSQNRTLTASDVLSLRLADIALDQAADLRTIAIARAYAEDRGLMKAQVSASENLGEVLHTARELAQHAQAEAKSQAPEGTIESASVADH